MTTSRRRHPRQSPFFESFSCSSPSSPLSPASFSSSSSSQFTSVDSFDRQNRFSSPPAEHRFRLSQAEQQQLKQHASNKSMADKGDWQSNQSIHRLSNNKQEEKNNKDKKREKKKRKHHRRHSFQTLVNMPMTQFDGRHDNWYPFWTTFKREVHHNSRLGRTAKHFLLQKQVTGSAKELLRLFDSAVFYKLAVRHLRRTYANSFDAAKEIIQTYKGPLSEQDYFNKNT